MEPRHGHDNMVIIVVVIISLGASLVAISCVLAAAWCYYFHGGRRKEDEKEKEKEKDPKPCQVVHGGGSHGEVKEMPQWDVEKVGFSASASNCGGNKEEKAGSGRAEVFTFKQLQLAASNFGPDNVIGQGGFGQVYKGTLSDGREVAIKRMVMSKRRNMKEEEEEMEDHDFRGEVDLLSRLHSPYLLKLMGYCADQDHRLLVYEHMPNGSLQEHLYSDGSFGNPPILDWKSRLRIAYDAARGLEYLHELNNPPVIHRDFKTSNILLDAFYNAKVSDFGLARIGSNKVDGQVSTRVLGTHGYVAPEYALTGHLTIKSDVYSYGVVLLELLTGRVPVDMKRPPGEGVLVSWALPQLTDKVQLEALVDPTLKGQYSTKELVQVAAIAKMCVQSEADYRPIMTDVVQTLAPLVKKRGKGSHTTSS